MGNESQNRMLQKWYVLMKLLLINAFVTRNKLFIDRQAKINMQSGPKSARKDRHIIPERCLKTIQR